MPQCARCRAQSREGAKFCAECGTPFARLCSACGAPAEGGRFCVECGTPLAGLAIPAPAAPPDTVGGLVSERRTTTVLFGDLVGFTSLAESRDPEEVRDLLSTYFHVARTVVGRYGGTIEKFIGDAVMAVWGVPTTHEDDAERAVRAGLDLVAEVAALGDRVGAPDLAMRVGLVTGPVAVTLGAVGEGMVAGDAVNTASRVQAVAAPGTVWVDHETRGLTAAAISFSDMGEHALKGKADPVRLFRADAVVAAVGGAQRVDGLEAPITGREAEIREVKELFHQTQSDGRARIVLVTGMPGVGKSRLGWEFEKYSDGLSDRVRWHRGRSLSYGEGVAFWAFAEMVRSRFGLLETATREEVRARVGEGLARYAADDAEGAWLAPRLEALLGVWEGAAFDRSDLFAAWTTFLDRVSENGAVPVVLLFEDMQYADSGLLDFVEHLLQATRAPLYALVLTRPELLDERPSLASGRRASVIDLQPLGEEAMVALVDGLVGDLPEGVRAAIVGRSDGVPLYAVETVRSLIDRDAVVARDGRYVFVDHAHALVDLDQLVAPTSLQTLIASRLDTLTPLERRTVQDASVLGMVFRRSALMTLNDVGGYELDQALAALVRKGVVEEQDDPRSPERGQYRFSQALVREVAYQTLARKDRRLRHLAVADHLACGDDAAETAGVIGRHLLDALAASGPQDDDQDAITARARRYLADAARRALDLGSFDEALASARSALSLDPGPLERAELQEVGSRAAYARGAHTESDELAAAAMAGYEHLGRASDVVRLLGQRATLALIMGRVQEARELAEAGWELRDGHAEVRPEDVAAAFAALANATWALGDVAAADRASMEQARIAEASGDPTLIVRSLNSIAISLGRNHLTTAYLALLDTAVDLARRHRLLAPLAVSLSNLAGELYGRELGRAVEIAGESVRVARQVGDPFRIEHALVNAGFAWRLSGDWDRLVDTAAEWLSDRELTTFGSAIAFNLDWVRMVRGEPVGSWDVPDSEDPLDRLTTLLLLGLRRTTEGRAGEVSGAICEAAVEIFGAGSYYEDFEVLWVPAVELQLAAGDLAAAKRLLALADGLPESFNRSLAYAETARMRGLVALADGADPEADLREAIARLEVFGAPYLAARSRLELGRWLAEQGRVAEGHALLADARESFVALGAVPSVAEVDAVAASAAR